MIIAQIATIPEREQMLKRVVDSLIDQVDYLRVYLNGYKNTPDFLTHSFRIETEILDNSTGDAAKFKGVGDDECYFFACDDDIHYPRNYTQYMIERIEDYKRKALITLHGRVMMPKPVYSYYRDKVYGVHCARRLARDQKVDTGGTGVMAFHTSTINLRYEDFKKPNMADIWIAKFAKEQNIPIIAVRHEQDWIELLDPEQVYETIWRKHYNDDKEQTELYNSF